MILSPIWLTNQEAPGPTCKTTNMLMPEPVEAPKA
eukprot:CAMPEP_0115533854 /NCGR_PEP_ID=MMETSP0271-20121206/86353_1 /TAXON_ID=71861 /ORGANISM="Scrippsiella trochoidea, Strain CCMP3099" /LENGTH=34 /DNA_ID= /DNA_START= /DNA_END= /DNA_ORIENTATION=